jgi:hypothetical protein
MDILPLLDTLMAYPMLGTAVCPETPRLMAQFSLLYNRKEGKKDKFFVVRGAWHPRSPSGFNGQALPVLFILQSYRRPP